MAANTELDRIENVYKQVEMQDAEERRLRDEELERLRVGWLEQMRVRVFSYYSIIVGRSN